MLMTRRKLLQSSMFAASLPFIERCSRLVGSAQTTAASDYKALVCVFLFGGNDANNLLVPTDQMNYGLYANARGQLALPQSQLLQLAGTSFGVHPSVPEIQSLFSAGNLAFVANAGSLVSPLTKAQYPSSSPGEIPQNLFSHPDQVAIMQTAAPLSSVIQGWGGNIIDAISPSYPGSTLPLAVSYNGAATYINGKNSVGLIAPSQTGSFPCSEGNACNAVESAMQKIQVCNNSVLLVQQDQLLSSNMSSVDEIYSKALSQATPFKAQFSSGGIGSELAQVARMIQLRQVVGAQRQVFFVGLGSFDTHANQLAYHATLLSQLSSNLNAFAESLQEMNVYNDVTLFTLSDFNRTLQPNSSGGTDHAWGSHLIVMGGAVKGKNIYGTFPTLELGGPDDVSTVGRFLPTTSISQMGADLASWFGVPDGQLPTIFPTLGNFPSYKLGLV
jgi:uncharacterized protein (DUF1501 family)